MWRKLAIVVVVGAALVLLYQSGFLESLLARLSLESLQERAQQQPVFTGLVFFLVYIAVTALSIPGAALMTLAGGAVFGLGWGLLLISFASSIGATLAFLVARFFLRNWVENKFSRFTASVNRGLEKDGAFYLFSLRLIPAIPFVAINLVFGLTRMRPWQFYWVSQLGMLAGTAVYVNAGAQLGAVESLSVEGILTAPLVLSFVLLAVFPWLARGALSTGVSYLQAQKIYRKFTKPKQFDYNLIAIGAGSGGLVSAYIGAAVKAKVALIEKHEMGGDCLNTGCVPSKALLKSASVVQQMREAPSYGVQASEWSVDFAQVMEKVQEAVERVAPHDSVERYTELGVDCISGEAQLLSPWEVQVGEKVLSARNIVIATGASPSIPDIPGLEYVPAVTSDTVWELRELPPRLLVIGGGPIGCELAQAFQRLGSEVTMVVRSELLPKEDRDIAHFVEQSLSREGVEILKGSRVEMCMANGGESLARVVSLEDLSINDLLFDTVLLATGRRPNTSGFGLAELGVEFNSNGTVKVDDYLRTRIPNIFACGDVAGPYQLTHAASHQAWYASVNALFGMVKKFKADYRVIPWVTYTDPELARVGLSETEAQQQGVEFEVTRYDLSDLDRAIVEDRAEGMVKVLTDKGSDRILGAAIVGVHGGELLAEFVLAMKQGIGLNKLLGTIHSYPTWGEANKYAAGVWKKNHAPDKILQWVEKWHRWQRNES